VVDCCTFCRIFEAYLNCPMSKSNDATGIGRCIRQSNALSRMIVLYALIRALRRLHLTLAFEDDALLRTDWRSSFTGMHCTAELSYVRLRNALSDGTRLCVFRLFRVAVLLRVQLNADRSTPVKAEIEFRRLQSSRKRLLCICFVSQLRDPGGCIVMISLIRIMRFHHTVE
jgi:hypothetical protein